MDWTDAFHTICFREQDLVDSCDYPFALLLVLPCLVTVTVTASASVASKMAIKDRANMSSCLSSRNVMRLFLASAMLFSAAAFPGGSGSCSAGTDAILQPLGSEALRIHGILGQVGTGPLDDFSMVLELDGVTLDPNTAANFTSGEEHTLSLIANGMTFTGFLIRMGAQDFAMTINSLYPIPGETPDGEFSTGGVRVATETCQSVNFVGGVTHQTGAKKSRVNTTLNMEEPSEGLELDVTVVIQTDDNANISEWYYSRYILNAVEPTNLPETDSPSQSPTSTLTEETDTPTKAPVDQGDGGVTMSMNVGVLFLGVVGSMWFL
jgi:hypothetical protein